MSGVYLQNSTSGTTGLGNGEPIPMSQVGTIIGSGITISGSTISIVPGTYYFSWSLLAQSDVHSNPNVLVALVKTSYPASTVATSGINFSQCCCNSEGTVVGETVIKVTSNTNLQLQNKSGHKINILLSVGESPEKFASSMTILRLA